MGSTQHPSEWVPWCSSPGGKEAGTMRLKTYLHLVPRLRMNGDVLSLPLYAFMTCTETTSYPSYLSPPLPTLFYSWQVSPCSGHPTFKFHEDGDSKILETTHVTTTIIYKQNSHMCVHNYRDEYTIQSPVFYMYGLLECHVTLISQLRCKSSITQFANY